MKKYFSLILLLFSNIFVFGQAIEVDTNSNVGIGTSAPSAKLDVVSSNASSWAVQILNNALGTGNGLFVNLGASTTGIPFSVSVNNSTKMLVNNAGNVGIGTSIPNAPLEINKNQSRTTFVGPNRGILHLRANSSVAANNEITAITFDDFSAGANSIIGSRFTPNGTNLFFGTSNAYVSGVTNTAMFIDHVGNIGIGTTSPSSILHVKGSSASVVVETNNLGLARMIFRHDINNNRGFIDYDTNAKSFSLKTDEVERLFISGTGNIGIGTSSPTTIGTYTVVDVQGKDTTNGGLIQVKTSDSLVKGQVFSDMGGISIGAATNHALRIFTNNIERARFDNNGNLGIGTSFPQNYGGFTTVDVSGASAGQAGRVQVKTFDSSVKGILGAESDKVMIDVATNHPLVFKTNDIERMRVDTSGNVGIGTTNPTAKLDVVSSNTSSWAAQIFNNASGVGHGLFVNLGASTTGIPFSVAVNNNYKMLVTNTGNVGIGTSGPTAKLDVVSTDTASYAAQILNDANGAGHGLYVNVGANSTGIPFFVAVNSNEKMRVANNGNVGIGIASPSEKLDVNGAVKATSFKVGSTTLNVPDYVFEDNYELKSLEEVHAFIEKNGHLPGISSAKEINANGLDLPEMQLKLLEKVEELTLYSINQHKEIQKLKDENKALKEKDELLETLLKRIENLEKNK